MVNLSVFAVLINVNYRILRNILEFFFSVRRKPNSNSGIIVVALNSLRQFNNFEEDCSA